MTDRYFAGSPIRVDSIVLSGQEAHHLVHVMRAKLGTEVVLFDGTGAEFAARVENVTRNQVELAVTARREVDRELPWRLTLGVSLPKGDRQRWLVEKTVELGLTRLVPLVTARSVAQPTEKVLGRLRRAVVEASKQCGRNRLMEIADPQNWADYLHSAGQSPCRWLAQPSGATSVSQMFRDFGETSEHVFLAVGPEGGLTDEEITLAAEAGWQTLRLGPRILRVETAAMLMVAWAAQGQ